MRTQFNTGNLYSKDGQRIVASQEPDGSIHFHDLARGIDGYLTDGSCLYGADPGPAVQWSKLTAMSIRTKVMEHYVRGDRYKSYSKIGAALRWEEDTTPADQLISERDALRDENISLKKRMHLALSIEDIKWLRSKGRG